MTAIEWTDETWNPWVGCDRIAPECDNCYAAVLAKRRLRPEHAAASPWDGRIVRNAESVRTAPLGWKRGRMVFTCSISDFWHESRPLDWLAEALDVIEATPQHTFQILTKRPGNILRHLGALGRRWPRNAWCGVTVGHSDSLPLLKPLRRIDAPLRFLSCEPLLDPVLPDLAGVGWVIAGGESERGARPWNLAWMRALIAHCRDGDVPVFVKQLGARPIQDGARLTLRDRKGGEPAEWPPDLRVREWPR
jgi:protein gp37